MAAIFAEAPEHTAVLQQQQSAATLRSRENDGGGFFTYVSVPETVPAVPDRHTIGENVYARIEGLKYGLGLFVLLKEGRIYCLDGYTIGVENTAPIDFETARFEMSENPF